MVADDDGRMCGERRASLPSAEKWRTALFNLAPLFAAIAYGVFYAVRTRTLFVSRDISTGRPCERRDPSPLASKVKKGLYSSAKTRFLAVWVPAFAGTTR